MRLETRDERCVFTLDSLARRSSSRLDPESVYSGEAAVIKKLIIPQRGVVRRAHQPKPRPHGSKGVALTSFWTAKKIYSLI